MANLTPNQAQWMWLAIALAITVSVVTLDVLLMSRVHAETTLSRVLARSWGRYWSIAMALAFWLGTLFGHAKLPTE